MEFKEWYDSMLRNKDSEIYKLITQREMMLFQIMMLSWNESQRISDTPILSAVPSEEAIATVKFAIMDGLSNSMHLSDPEKIRDSVYKSIFDDAIKWATKEVAERGIAG